MTEDATVSILAMAFVVKDAWSIVVELACFAFVALTFQVILAQQRRVCHYFASW